MARGKKAATKINDFKRANGTGCIRLLSGNRRKPYAAVLTVGRKLDDKTGKFTQIRKYLGTYESPEEAQQALDEYNFNPYDLCSRDTTFEDIYKIIKAKKYDFLSDSTKNCYFSAYKYCELFSNEYMCNIKTAQLQDAIDSCPHGSSTKGNIKVIMNNVFEYAMQNDIVSKNYAEFVTFEESEPTFERKIFSKKDIDYLWSTSGNFDSKIILILLYTGMRVNELLKLPRELCNLEERYLDIPKELAKNKPSIRKVPIHNDIYDFVKYFYDLGGKNLITKESGVDVPYNNFVAREFKRMNEHFECTHRIHDTRHTMVSRAAVLGMKELYLKRIIGHSGKGITENVYTHIGFKELLKEIQILKY